MTMSLDDLIVWTKSQATRCEAEANEYAETGHSVASTVDMFRGRAEIHREIAQHLGMLKKLLDSPPVTDARRRALYMNGALVDPEAN